MLTIVQVADYLRAIAPPLGPAVKQGTMPESPDSLIAVYEYPGMAPDGGFGNPGIQHETPGIQIMVRGVALDYEGPRVIMARIWDWMSRIQAKTVGGTVFLMVRPTGSVGPLPKDANGRWKFTASFLANKEPS